MNRLTGTHANNSGAMQARTLVVSDDLLLGSTLVRGLRRSGQDAESCDPGEARGRYQSQWFDVVLLDVKDLALALVFLGELRVMAEAPAVLVVVSQVGPHGIVELMRKGAHDVLVRPLDLSEVQARVERIVETGTMKRRLAALTREKKAPSLVAESPAMKEVLRLVERVARTPRSSVLLLGESGVGKEKVAEAIHLQSQRRAQPFVQVNMAALPDTMVEAELFGHARGAFTGAAKPRAGLLASAEGGTLLMDELAELRIELQPKLLRVLEERRYFPVGSDQERRIDVRLLAATNRNPEEAIQKGWLREDLYYRLSTVTIEIPPLRERTEDILPLARRFLESYALEFGRGQLQLSEEACERLLEHRWRGNVRELRNVMERVAMLAEEGEIQAEELGLSRSEQKSRPQLREVRLQEAMDETERARLALALQEASGDVVRAARLLGISRSTLYSKRKRFGL
ncbi:MAG: sigma-54 dependent transcriptional regulator [Polyangiaceae bacterium]|jgi:DNA-binding NtrC family response regulator|nr:sigma-54 dependent transcriptional regulator [Polyangiaceae bacterium]